MGNHFYELAGIQLLAGGDALSLTRAQGLAAAIGSSRDYELIAVGRINSEGRVCEVIVVEVTCDGVAPRNASGIQYTERLALLVPADPGALVEVLALRRDFPILIHQNATPPDSPASLCLYFEPAISVSRTWTPKRFLRRIQWWLEESSRGSLHASDQPLEGLFLRTNIEVVLPANFDELSKRKGVRFWVERAHERTTPPGHTFVLGVRPEEEAPRWIILVADVPPIEHGRTERNPASLGGLVEVLEDRGIDLLPRLKEALHDAVGQAGLTRDASDREKFVLVLLRTPITRASGTEPESVDLRAFAIVATPGKLGCTIGALALDGGKYRRVAIMGGAAGETGWKNLELVAADVRRLNDPHAYRRQSGTADRGFDSVLVGAGALGSAMSALWSRSGWGRWTIVDKDHVKPHNLTRHMALALHVGMPKSDVASVFHGLLEDGTIGRVESLVTDVCDLANGELLGKLQSASLVVDASTTLEYPRAASALEGVGRHVSVFITPSGQGSVLLAEDLRREIRLRTLEAQYYRAAISSSWGEDHLAGNLGTFWSGAGCRDISMVLPYSRVMAHACCLAEQVQHVALQSEARIAVWHRDADTGEVRLDRVPVQPETSRNFDTFVVYFDDGLVAKLRSLRSAHSPRETGGVLLGYFDFNVNAVVIVDALVAPPDSTSREDSFTRGVEGLAEAVAEVSRRTAGVVGYLGEWHSHPPGHSARPSLADIRQLAYLAAGMEADGLPAFSLIVGESEIEIISGSMLPG